MKHRYGSPGRLLAWAAVIALTLAASRAGAAGETRELKAREEFAAGRYQQALDLFAKLYAETLHPVYLRNIGRCYQNLGDADRAIISFRDYLRKHETISAKERKEVEGFIAEMEALKKQPASAPSRPEPEPAPAKAEATDSTVAPLPPAPEPAGSVAAPAALVTASATPAAEESPALYTRWWFWTLVGAAAVGAGLGIAAATGAFTSTNEPSCPREMGYTCPQ